MKKIITIITAISLTGCFGPSDEQKEIAETACKDFVLEELASKYTHEAHAFDTYTKNDKIVVEVGYRETQKYIYSSDGDSYSVRICVYDEKNGTISIPSVFNMNDWKK